MAWVLEGGGGAERCKDCDDGERESCWRQRPGRGRVGNKADRQSSKCTMHLATQILANRPRVALLKLIVVCGRASRRAHNMQVTTCKTQGGCVELGA